MCDRTTKRTAVPHLRIADVARQVGKCRNGATNLVRSADLGRLVSATYPLGQYTDALRHAAEAGPRGAIKIAFDLRSEKR